MDRTTLLVAATAVLFVAMTVAGARTAGESAYPPVVAPAAPAAPSVTIVQPGDHLWKISERHLSGVLEREPSDAEISPYWRLTIEQNRDQLRSGDPDLIFPGEQVELPAGPSDSP
jgi:nucleoid-associated protein YgaU